MDKLDQIFGTQAALNSEIRAIRHLDHSPSEWIQKETLAMLSELAELLDEVNFKWWKNEKPVCEADLKGELVDILHFFVSMCLDAGLTADELHALYLAKNRENHDRQHGRSEKKGYEAAP